MDKVERLEKPTEEHTDVQIVLEPEVTSGNDVLTVSNLAKAYGAHRLFSDLSFELKRGERVALIGNNGTGKTTILKLINGLEEGDGGSITLGTNVQIGYFELKRGERVALIGNNGTGKTTILKLINGLEEGDGGSITLGTNVQIGYYDQEHQLLHMEKTIFEEISDAYPQLNNTKIRNVLAAFLFTNDDVFKRISDLSGGERGRVSLAKLMLSNANFLILDEPTNHLDITSKEILESALNQYTGTVLFVSHDRYFINQTATRILELTGETLVNYLGNYDYYLEKREELTRVYASLPDDLNNAESDKETEDAPAAKADWKQQKAEQARLRKLMNELKRTEERIASLEAELAEIDAACALPQNATNSAKLNELGQRQETCRSELDACYETWERLSLETENFSG